MADVGEVRRQHDLTLGLTAKLIKERDALQAQLTQAQAEVAALREVVDAAEYLRSEASNYTRDSMGSKNTTLIDAIEDFDAARAKVKETTSG